MIVRAWTEKDIKTIAEMETRCFSDPWSLEMLQEAFKSPFCHCVLTEEAGRVCAYACLFVLFEDAEVQNIAVDIPFRGQGIGKELLTFLHGEAKRLGAYQSLLEVRVSNVAAIGLYEKLGYEKYGERKKYYGDGESAYVMKKIL